MNKSHSDLTRGSLGKQILLFSLPLISSNLLQVLFNLADLAVVGQFAGSNAMGSVGSTTILVTLFTGFLIGMASGVNVLAALHYGAKSLKQLRSMIHCAALLCLFTGLLLTILGILLAKPVLLLLGTKEDLLDGALLYIRIYFLGMPALALYNFGNAVFSAVGNTKKPLLYLTAAGILNVVLNLFFVLVCRMTVDGVALASILSQYVSAILVLGALLRTNGVYSLRLQELRLDRSQALDILRIGLPAGFQHAIFQIANLFIQAGVNTFDSVVVSGNAAAANADQLVYETMSAFYTACGSFMGQNYGARNKARVRNSYFISLAYSFGIAAVLGLLLVLFGDAFLGLFTDDPAVAAAGMKRLTIMGLSYPVSAFMDNTIAACRALGKSIVPTVIVIVGSCVFRILWVNTVFAYFRTIPSLYLLYVFSWALTSVAAIFYFIRIYRQRVAVL